MEQVKILQLKPVNYQKKIKKVMIFWKLSRIGKKNNMKILQMIKKIKWIKNN